MGLDFPNTCPKIDKAIENIHIIINDQLDGDIFSRNFIFDLMSKIDDEIETLRRLNSDMRDKANEQIDELEDEKSILNEEKDNIEEELTLNEQEIAELKSKVYEYEETISELKNTILLSDKDYFQGE